MGYRCHWAQGPFTPLLGVMHDWEPWVTREYTCADCRSDPYSLQQRRR